jgi:hypothetical protein
MKTYQHENGNVLLMALVLCGLAGIVAIGVLDATRGASATAGAKKTDRAQNTIAQGGVPEAISFLRQYSQQMVNPFRRDEFYNRFTKTSATVGSNDTNWSPVTTFVKLKDTQNSAMIVSDTNMGTAAFPQTWDITTNTAFDAVGNFFSASMGKSRIRLTLVNAIADDPAKDYGPPPANAPETDFYPVYRVDSYNTNDAGSHFYAYMTGVSRHVFDMGIYGQDYLEIRQQCDSYISANGAYSDATKRANCPAGSNSTSQVHKNEEIYGSLQTNGSIVATAPWGGETCKDFTPGCPNKGETCAGEDCGVPLLDIFKDWTTYCPAGSEQATVTAGAATTISIAAPGAAENSCWTGLTIGSNKSATLTSTAYPYYIRTLDIANNGNIKFVPDNPSKPIQLYVQTIVGNALNGNMVINGAAGQTPKNVMIYYLGTAALTLNGTASIQAGIVAPKAAVTVSGAFDYFGALLAKRLTLTGSGKVHYDESLGGNGAISDMQYKVYDFSQRFR